jgi:hypothetical protein
MQPVRLIARLVGPVFVVVGVGVMVNRSLYVEMIADAVRVPILIYLSGLLTLSAGIAMLNGYRAWTLDWRVIVTVLGWLFVIGGIIRIVLPAVAASIAPAVYAGPTIMALVGIVVLAVGAFLTFRGYQQ